MKIKNKFSAILLSILMMSALCVSSASATESEVAPVLPDAIDIAYIDNIFESGGLIKVYDAQGNNITTQFYEDQGANYADANYSEIFDALAAQDLTVVESKIAMKPSASARLTFTYTVTGSKTIAIQGMNGTLKQNAVVYATGEYYVNAYIMGVHGASSPTFSHSKVVGGQTKDKVNVYTLGASASWTTARASFVFTCSGDFFSAGIAFMPAGYFDSTSFTFYGYP